MPSTDEEPCKRSEQQDIYIIETSQERVVQNESDTSYKDKFDYILVNDDLDKAKAEVLQIAKEYLCECNN